MIFADFESILNIIESKIQMSLILTDMKTYCLGYKLIALMINLVSLLNHTYFIIPFTTLLAV